MKKETASLKTIFQLRLGTQLHFEHQNKMNHSDKTDLYNYNYSQYDRLNDYRLV